MKIFRWLRSFVIITLITLVLAECTFRVLIQNEDFMLRLMSEPTNKVGMYFYHSELGWISKPGYDENFDYGYRIINERINSQGLRDHDYTYQKPEDVFRIAVIGCSRTYGYGTQNDEAYPKVLERTLNEKSQLKIEVINFGVNGYGLDQFVLNYEHNIRNYDPDLVLLQLYPPNIVRTQYTKMWGRQKPKFVIDDGQLALINYPVPENEFGEIETFLIDKSVLYRTIKFRMLRLEEQLRKKTNDYVPSNQYVHTLATLMLQRLKIQVDEDQAQLVAFVWQDDEWLDMVIKNAGISFFNLNDYADINEWKKKGDMVNPLPTGHWSPLGNEYVAHAIFQYFKEKNIGNL